MGEPYLAIAKPGDRGNTPVDRPPPLPSQRHFALDAAGRADLDLVHTEGVALQKPTDHFGGRHRLGFRTTVGDGFFGERLDAGFDAREFVGLAQKATYLRWSKMPRSCDGASRVNQAV
jgi:hypothetical protein